MSEGADQLYELGLACGHSAPGRPKAHEKLCRTCGAMSPVVAIGDPVPPSERKVTSTTAGRSDGLMVRTFTRETGAITGYQWWCRWCHGKRPLKDLLKQRLETKELVFEGWDGHKATDGHRAEGKWRGLVAELADQLDGSTGP